MWAGNGGEDGSEETWRRALGWWVECVQGVLRRCSTLPWPMRELFGVYSCMTAGGALHARFLPSFV